MLAFPTKILFSGRGIFGNVEKVTGPVKEVLPPKVFGPLVVRGPLILTVLFRFVGPLKVLVVPALVVNEGPVILVGPAKVEVLFQVFVPVQILFVGKIDPPPPPPAGCQVGVGPTIVRTSPAAPGATAVATPPSPTKMLSFASGITGVVVKVTGPPKVVGPVTVRSVMVVVPPFWMPV